MNDARLNIDQQLLVEVGLGHLDPEQQRVILKRIFEVMELRVGHSVASTLTSAQQETFEQLIENDAEAAEAYLHRVIPDYVVMVRNDLDFIVQSLIRSLHSGTVEIDPDIYDEQAGAYEEAGVSR